MTKIANYRGYELHSARLLTRFALCPNRSIRVIWEDPSTGGKMRTYGAKYWQLRNTELDMQRALIKTKRSIDRLIDRGKLPDLLQLAIPGVGLINTKLQPSNPTLPHCTP